MSGNRDNLCMDFHMAAAKAGLGYTMGWLDGHRAGGENVYEVELRASGRRLFYRAGVMVECLTAGIEYADEWRQRQEGAST